jgi:CHAT domain-containing protein
MEAAGNKYEPVPTPQQIEVKANKTAQLIFLNLVKPGMHLAKLDSATVKPRGNATYLIQKIGGSFIFGNEVVQRNAENLRENFQLVVGDETRSDLNAADAVALYRHTR